MRIVVRPWALVLGLSCLLAGCLPGQMIATPKHPFPSVETTIHAGESAPIAIRYPGGLLTPDGQSAIVRVDGVGITVLDTSNGAERWKRDGDTKALAVDHDVVLLEERQSPGQIGMSLRNAATGQERASFTLSLPECHSMGEPRRDGAWIVIEWTERNCPSGTPMPPRDNYASGQVRIDFAAGRFEKTEGKSAPVASSEEVDKAAIAAMPAAIDRASLMSYFTGLTWQRRPLQAAGRFVALTSAGPDLELVFWSADKPEALTRVKHVLGQVSTIAPTTDGGHLLVRRPKDMDSWILSLIDGRIVGLVRIDQTSSLAQGVTVAGGLVHWAAPLTGRPYGEDFTLFAADTTGTIIWKLPVLGKHSPNPA